MRTLSLLHLTIATLALAASPSLAAVISVSPGESVQAAIDGADPGDEIQLAPGIYPENLVIGNSKDEITLRGMGNKPGDVIIDARPNPTNGSGPGIRIDGSEVLIENLLVRHAFPDGLGKLGNGIEVDADEVTLREVHVERSQKRGIEVEGDLFVADRCEVFGNGDCGIEIEGNQATVKSCKVRQNRNAGIVIVGNNCKVTKTDILTVKEGPGIKVNGNGVTIANGKVSGTFLEAIDIDGNNALVKKNKIRACANDGVKINGSKFTVSKNNIKQLLFEGDAVRISNATSGSVTKNTVKDIAESAVKLTSCSGVTVNANEFSFCGTDKSPTILVNANCSDVKISSNDISNGQGDGIRVDGSGNQVNKNTVTRCREDGIDLEGGNGHSVSDNTVKDCSAEGIENNATNTDLTDNSSKGSRLDLASDGSFDEISGNVFDTGGPGVPPLLDE